MTTPAVTIAARQASRWRCGVEFTDRAMEFPAGRWADDDLAQLRADPQLVVAETAGADPAGAAGGQPATPTVEAALETALSALRQATPDQVWDFFRRMAEDPEIAPKIDDQVDRQERLIVAIAGLEEGNEEHWTRDKRPQVSAIEAATGLRDVSAAERDAAWAEYLKAAGKDLTGG